MITIILTATIGLIPITVPDPPPPYGWVCDYLDTAPTVFGVMGLPGELEERGLDLADARTEITAVVRNDCPQHIPLLNSLSLVFGS